ncbi:uncharacterized protein LOC127288976 [Leptopilina boulardi]|uniref:uncharacterized protein LOC127288976 n=1 Tax=Leptopilina boulardi TaxID=63433 RepID=UPI0021F63309|nr:uncharacterized protein LOC127288976 [Leptopilina boulardi]
MFEKIKKKLSFKILKWDPKNIHDSIVPILILNWITGLNIFEYPLSKPRPAFTFIYVLLLNFSYWFFGFSARHVTSQGETQIGKNVYVLIVYVNVFIGTSSILIGWYHYKAFKANIQRLESLDEALEYLGLPNKYREIFINAVRKVIIWVIVIIILIYYDLNLFLSKYDLHTSLNLIYLFHFPLHLNSVVDFTFSSLVTCLGRRFANINSLLKRTLPIYDEIESVREVFPKYSKVHVLMASKEFNINFNDNSKQLKVLVLVRYLHMELSKISWELNRIYGKQMMMKMGAHFIIITGLSYNLFTYLFFVNESLNDKNGSVVSTTIWFAVYCFRFLQINSTCAKVTTEARKTRSILFELKNSNRDKAIIEEIEEFSLQLTQRPLAFSTGLNTLDYAFVRTFIGSVTTYLVLLIQFSPEIRKCERIR